MSTLTVEDFRKYTTTSATDDEIQSAIDAETAAQTRVCRIPDPMPVDVLEALKRRVQRNLAMRALPLGSTPQGDAELSQVIPSRDPEVRRLEGPFRKLVFG
jgi:hypothetical protein